MSHEYSYYLVGEGPTLAIINAFFEEKKANQARSVEIAEKYGAKNAYWSSCGISGLAFEENPDSRLWKGIKKADAYEPSKRNPDREAILAEFRTAYSMGARQLQDRIVGKDSMMLFTDTRHDLHFMGVEGVEKDGARLFVLHVPFKEEGFIDWVKNEGNSEQPPTTMTPWPIPPELTLLKKSEYFALIGE